MGKGRRYNRFTTVLSFRLPHQKNEAFRRRVLGNEGPQTGRAAGARITRVLQNLVERWLDEQDAA